MKTPVVDFPERINSTHNIMRSHPRIRSLLASHTFSLGMETNYKTKLVESMLPVDSSTDKPSKQLAPRNYSYWQPSEEIMRLDTHMMALQADVKLLTGLMQWEHRRDKHWATNRECSIVGYKNSKLVLIEVREDQEKIKGIITFRANVKPIDNVDSTLSCAENAIQLCLETIEFRLFYAQMKLLNDPNYYPPHHKVPNHHIAYKFRQFSENDKAESDGRRIIFASAQREFDELGDRIELMLDADNVSGYSTGLRRNEENEELMEFCHGPLREKIQREITSIKSTMQHFAENEAQWPELALHEAAIPRVIAFPGKQQPVEGGMREQNGWQKRIERLNSNEAPGGHHSP